MKQFSTNDGQNHKGDVYLILAFVQPIVHQMAPGWMQVALTSLTLLVLAWISYRTVGNIPPEQAEIVKRKIEDMEAIDEAEGEDLLEMGRR